MSRVVIFCLAQLIVSLTVAAVVNAAATGAPNAALANTPLHADVFVDMEAGDSGSVLTSAILTDGTHGSGGKWTVSGAPKPLSKFYVCNLTGKMPLSVILADGSICKDTGVRGWDYDHSVGAQTVDYRFTAPHSNFSVGCFVSFGVANGWNSNFDYIQISVTQHGSNGCWANMKTSAKGNFIRTETIPAKVTTWGPDIALTPEKKYWMTFHFYSGPSDSKFTLMIIDPDTWKEVGSSSGPMDDNVSAGGMKFGIDNNHATSGPWHSYWSDIVMDWTKAQFPLAPAKVLLSSTAPEAKDTKK